MLRTRSRPGTRRPLALLGVVGALGVGLLGGCADSGYQYVKAPTDDAFFKVPDGWKLYRITTGQPTDRPEPIDLSGGEPWRLIFDASSQPTPDHMNEGAPAAPVGMAVVQDLSGDVRDNVTLKQLRTLAIDGESDPIDLINQADPRIEPISYNEISMGSGLRGSHIAFNWKLDDGTWRTVDFTALVNGPTTRAYLFKVQCSSDCFLQHKAEIGRIVGSWTVEKDG